MTIQPTLERHAVQLLGHEFQYAGKMEPIGPMIDYLNDPDRLTFPLYDVEMHHIVPGSSLPSVARPEITVARREVGLIYLPEPEYRATISFIKNFEQAIAYTPYVVCRGKIHMGAETWLRDLLSLMTGSFLVMTEVSVFPLTSLPASFPEKAEVLLLNREYITVYHAD